MGLEETLALIPAISPWRERPELLSRLAPLNPPASGARDVPARSGSECNRRLGEGSGTSRLSEPLRPGTGRAPKEGSWGMPRVSSVSNEPPLPGPLLHLMEEREFWLRRCRSGQSVVKHSRFLFVLPFPAQRGSCAHPVPAHIAGRVIKDSTGAVKAICVINSRQ